MYSVSGGKLTEGTPITLPAKNPAGQRVNMYPAGLAVTPDGRKLVVADEMADSASVVDLATGDIETLGAGQKPYGVAISPDGKTAYVSDQGASTVTTVDIAGSAPTVTGTVDSTFYSTVSMLRTIELIVGIEPMTQFDASAIPMFSSFTGKPDFTPYTAVQPSEPILKSVNTTDSPMAKTSAQEDLSTEDQLNPALANEEIWQSVKGKGSTMPAPQHHVIGSPASGDEG